MKFIKTDKGYVLRLEKGESFISSLTSFCAQENVKSCFFNGLGSSDNVELGFYDMPSKSFKFQNFVDPLELVSMSGIVTLVDNKPFIHAHGVFSGNDFKAIGGHIKDFQVGPTVEIFLTDLNVEIGREFNEEIGLKLLDFR